MVGTVILNAAGIMVLSFYLAYIYTNSKRNELIQYYFWMHFFAILVLVVGLLTFLAPNKLVVYTFTLVSCIIGLYFSISFFLFGYYYANRSHLKVGWLLTLLGLPLICLLSLSLVNPATQAFKLLHYLFVASGLLLQFFSCALIIRFLTIKSKKYRLNLLILFLAFFSFLAQFLVMSLGKGNWNVINPILVVGIFSLIFFGFIRFGLFETLSIGVRKSLELYQEPIFVLNVQGDTLYTNMACQAVDTKIMNQAKDKLDEVIHRQKWIWEEKQIELTSGERILTLSIRPLTTIFHQVHGYVCIIHDDTAFKSVIVDLKNKNEELIQMNIDITRLEEQAERLALVEARNILAKEIHDVLGHSLNLALHTLESNKVILENYPQQAIMRLEQVLNDIDKGFDEIATTYDKSGIDRHLPYITLNGLLQDMAKRLLEVNVQLEVIGADKMGECSPDIAKAIFRLCQEACTNAIKHGKADSITLSVKRHSEKLNIHIVDNGTGCTQFAKGSGLKGMEERIEKLGGTIKFSSFEDEGFLINASIPLIER